MKYLFLLLALGALNILNAQDTTFSVENFNIKFESSKLTVTDNDEKVYQRDFSDPISFTLDLDSDGVDELLVSDSEEKDGLSYYTLYVFNCTGSFFLTDSIYSGLKEPYVFDSDEINNIVIVTGSPDFDSLYVPELEVAYSPLICWSFVDTSLAIVNDQLYDPFIDENNKNIELMDAIYKEKGKDCKITESLKQIIATTYANYIYADEKALAERALVQYYYCEDLKQFKENIEKLL
ncbi:MAG: hypothetical protein Q8933_12925 [Bacteroidota bacterium]|nr:hypothetical protein [Bacteroidota bacterium]MDP4193988.1 hypothetical protein [Bacteroidota bacterium]